MKIITFMSVLCLFVLLLVISGCASKAPAAEDTAPGLVAEQTGNIQVEMPEHMVVDGPAEESIPNTE